MIPGGSVRPLLGPQPRARAHRVFSQLGIGAFVPAPRSRWVEPFEFLDDLEEIHDRPMVGNLEDRCGLISIDSDDRVGPLMPDMCCTAPETPNARYTRGLTVVPDCPTKRVTGSQPESISGRVPANATPIRSARRCIIANYSLAIECLDRSRESRPPAKCRRHHRSMP